MHDPPTSSPFYTSSTSSFYLLLLSLPSPTLTSYLDAIEHAVANGDCLLLENIGESVDPVLDTLLGRLTIKKGKYIKIGDKEVEYSPRFRLILQVSESYIQMLSSTAHLYTVLFVF